MYTQGFVDDYLEVGQAFNYFRVSDGIVTMSQCLVQFFLKFGLDLWIAGEVVCDGA